MDRLATMALYCAIVEGGSLAAAARSHQLSGPAVVRALHALEARLGIRLLDRTTRRLRPTEAGLEYLQHCRDVLRLTRHADQLAQRHAQVPCGRLHLTAPRMFGRLHVAPVAFELMRQHPGLTIELTLDDRVLDLLERDVDAAVRIGPLPDSSLRAARLGETRRVLCAAPSYLKRHGEPATPQDLAGCARLVFVSGGSDVAWELASPGSVAALAHTEVSLRSNSLETLIDAAVAGLGVVQASAYQVAAALQCGALKPLLTAHAPAPLPIHLVYAASGLRSATVQALKQALVQALREPQAPPTRGA